MSKHPESSDAQGSKIRKEDKEREELEPLNTTSVPSETQSSIHSAVSIPQDQRNPADGSIKQSLTLWIKENISKQQCRAFQSDPSQVVEDLCYCGNLKTDHTNEVIKEGDSSRIHNPPTDAFGEIHWKSDGSQTSKYIRVSADTEATVLYKLLTEQWELPRPNLLISVTGGAKNFYLKSHLKKVFYRGLMKIAQTTDAWIITGGTNVGVMRHVGQAVRDYALSNSMQRKIVAIGVAPWGVIQNRDKLVNKEGCFRAPYVIDTKGVNLTCLDENHTHFLLVDDGTYGRYGVEIKLRAELEKLISLENKENNIKISVVCVVLNGGLSALNTIYNAVNKGTPCVILQGSGRLADVIAHVSGQQNSTVKIDKLIENQLEKCFGQEYESSTFKSQEKEYTEKIQEIIKKRELLTIFRARKDGQGNLDVAILDALFKASKTGGSQDKSWNEQLELAIDWNRANSAETEIFTEESVWKSDELHRPMKLALIRNKPDFVSLLLENGLILKDFLKDDNTLCELYQNLPKCFFLYKLVKRVEPDKIRKQELHKEDLNDIQGKIRLIHVSNEVHHLLGKFTQPIYPLTPMRPLHEHVTVRIKELFSGCKDEAKREGETQRDAAGDLFLWAVVQKNKELAEIAWDQCRDSMSAALAASKILKKMAQESIDADEAQEMQELAKHYENHAIGVFSECYKNDEERAQKLLVRISRLWGKTTCLRLALEADNKNFVAESGVQAHLTTIWCGELSVHNPVWKVLLCMVFFPLIYTGFLVFRCDELLQKKIEQNDEIKTGEEEKNTEEKNTENCVMKNLKLFKQRVEPLGSRLVGLYGSPQVKFYGNIFSYFAFLFLFAYVLMIDFQSTPSVVEMMLYIWLFSLACEEIRQIFYDPDDLRLHEKVEVYIQDLWNILDILSIVLFCLGFVFRLTTRMFYPGKIILCIDFVVFCLRLMAIFTISQTLGPKIIIVRKMMMDIFFFMFLLSIWVMAYGVAKQGILIHNDNRLDWIIRGAVYEPYLIIFGSIPENIDNAGFDINSCSMNGTDPTKPKCPVLNENQMPAFPEWLTIIMLCVYLLFANILLLNLLIAIFNYTFQEIHENTDRIWKFQRYQLIKEYDTRPSPPPPFIIVSHIQFMRNLVLFREPIKHKFKKDFPEEEEEELLSWEALMKDRYLLSARQDQSQSMEGRILDTSQKATTLIERLERLEKREEKDTQSNAALQMSGDSLKSQDDPAKTTQRQIIDKVTTLTDRMQKLEEQVTSALQRIEDSLKSLGAPAGKNQ